MRILYLQDNGVVAIIYPSSDFNPKTGNPWTAEEVAAKDVPKGKKYKIVEDSDCLLYTSPSPRDLSTSRMPSSA